MNHIWRVPQHMLKHKKGFTMYIDFNKAFHNVPKEALWGIVSRVGVSAECIESWRAAV